VIPESLKAIVKQILGQDNRCTDAPMFIVQERKRIWGISEEYSEDSAWIDTESGDTIEADDKEAAILDSLRQSYKDVPDNWEKVGYIDQWEFVTACFTEQGCKDYLAANGHNHGETRIYAAGSYRNAEFRSVREFLKSIALVKSDSVS